MGNRLPNLVCPGAQKSGTTTLASILEQHPDIFLKTKEPHFYDIYFDRGIDYYRNFFKDVTDEKYIVDMTPVYMYFEDIPKAMLESLGPDIKFVFILRNPVDRVYSSYNMKRAKLTEPCETIEEALALENERISQSRRYAIAYSYHTRNFYAKQIKSYMKYYPVENMHFLIFEEFIKDIRGESEKLFDFLGISKEADINYDLWSNKTQAYKHPVLIRSLRKAKRFLEKMIPGNFVRNIAKDNTNWIRKIIWTKNGIPEKSPVNPETCRSLMKEYVEDIGELEKITGKDLSFWIEKYS